MKTVVLIIIRVYQVLISPWLGERCRFYPSCSEYARLSVARHGSFHGIWLAVKRIVRCQPFAEGGFDPVPQERSPEPNKGM